MKNITSRCVIWFTFWLLLVALLAPGCVEQKSRFAGLKMNLGNLPRLSDAKTRSISPESFTGEKGKGGMATKGTGARAARELGQGWKVSPSIPVPSSISG